MSHWYAGGPADEVEVEVAPGRLSDLVADAHLHVGDRYLVAASDGAVTGCGYTGPAGGTLQALYDRAFG